MKNKYFLILLVCGLIQYSCTADKEAELSDIENMNLKGKIKSIKSIEYEAKEKFGEIVKEKVSYDRYENFHIVFNQSGYQTEHSSYPYGELEKKYMYQYDENGNRIEINEYSSDGNLENKSMFKFDDGGNPVQCDIYNGDGTLENLIVFTYKDNKINQYEKRDSKGKIVLKYYSKYKENHLEETLQYGVNEKLEKRYLFKYDKNGNQTERRELDSSGSLIQLITSIYDENENEIERNIYDADEILENKHTYKYNEQNNLIEHINNDISYQTFTYKYNENGDLDEQVNFDLEGKETYRVKNNYKYDSSGNWIERIHLNGIVPKTITEREIHYY